MKMFAMAMAVGCLAVSAVGGEPYGLMVERQEKVLKPFDHYTWNDTGDLNTYCVTRGNNICI